MYPDAMPIRGRWVFVVVVVMAVAGLVLTLASESPRGELSRSEGYSLTSVGTGLPDAFQAVTEKRAERWAGVGLSVRLLLVLAPGAVGLMAVSRWSRRELDIGYPDPLTAFASRAITPRAPPAILV